MCPAPIPEHKERGFIIPIGGGEDKEKEMLIHRKFVELSGGGDSDIIVVPTASQLERTGPDYNSIFRELGAGGADLRADDDDCLRHRRVRAEAQQGDHRRGKSRGRRPGRPV